MAGQTNIALTSRDRRILSTVAVIPFLSALEIEALFFPSDGHAGPYSAARRRRLQKLVKAEYLLTPPRSDSRTPLFYALTKKGSDVVQKNNPSATSDEIASFKKSTLPTTRLEHYRIIAEFYTALRLTLEQTPNITLDRYIGEKFLNTPGQYDRVPSLSGALIPLVPDGLAVLRRSIDQKRRFVFLEADTGTETQHIIKRKIEAYTSYRLGSGKQIFRQRFAAEPAFRVVFVTQSIRRRENMQRTAQDVLQRHGVPTHYRYFLFLTRKMLMEETHKIFE